MAVSTARRSTRLIAPLALGALLLGAFVPGALAGSPPSLQDTAHLQDIAQGKPSEQSSTEFGGTPDRAVDGDTNGDHFADSVTHTSNGPGEWWQVDLGGTFDIREIVIWNRTDCCAERLHDVLVLVSADPFPPTAVSEPTGWSAVIPGVADQETRIPVEVRGRYVRVQQTVAEYLSLAEVEVWSSLGPVPSPMPTPSPTPAPTPTSSATGATSGVWTLVAGSPRHESTKGSKDSRYAETFGGGAGSASISISIQPPDPHDPPSIRSDTFTWTHPAATLRPGDRVVMPLAITEQANSGFGYYASGLFARFTRPGQPCGIVRAGDIDVGIVMIGSLMDPPPPPSGEFIVPAPAPGFSGPETSQQMQLQVCANVYQSQTASYYVYEWKPAAATAPSGPKASPTATPPTRAKLVVRVAAPERVPSSKQQPQVIRYLIRLTNEGNGPATGVSQSWTASFDSGWIPDVKVIRASDGWTCADTDRSGEGRVDCRGGSLGPGASATAEVTLGAPPSTDMATASVTASGACGGAGQCEGSWHGITQVESPVADLQLRILAPAQVKAGDAVTYHVVVKNVGTAPASDVLFQWQYPRPDPFTGPAGWTCEPDEIYPFRCGGDLAVGKTATWTVLHHALPPVLGQSASPIEAAAQVLYVCGGNPCKAEDTSQTAVITPAENPLKLSVSAPSTVRNGEQISGVVRLTNSGTGPVTVHGVTIYGQVESSGPFPDFWHLTVSGTGFRGEADCGPAAGKRSVPNELESSLRCGGDFIIHPGATAAFRYATIIGFSVPRGGALPQDISATFSVNARVEAHCMPDDLSCVAGPEGDTTKIRFKGD